MGVCVVIEQEVAGSTPENSDCTHGENYTVFLYGNLKKAHSLLLQSVELVHTCIMSLIGVPQSYGTKDIPPKMFCSFLLNVKVT